MSVTKITIMDDGVNNHTQWRRRTGSTPHKLVLALAGTGTARMGTKAQCVDEDNFTSKHMPFY